MNLKSLSLSLAIGCVTISASALTAAAAVSDRGGVSVNPSTIDLVLNPNDSVSVPVTVCIPGQVVPTAQVDVYILADTTGSMDSVLDSVKANVNTLTGALIGRPSADIRVGIGNYKDFPIPASAPFAFQHQQSITDNVGSVAAAVNAWNASGGADTAEGQFFALHQIATDPAIGFRPTAKRIVVWFGDAPAHDPICTALTGLAFPITQASVTTDLLNAGPGGTTVLAISTPTGVAGGLNADPVPLSDDYIACGAPGGSPNQATNIAAATGGFHSAIASPNDIVQAILDSIETVIQEVDITLQPKGNTAQFVASITPPSAHLIVPNDPAESACATFIVNFRGLPCATSLQTLFEGEINVLANGAPTGAEIRVTVSQPECGPLSIELASLSATWYGSYAQIDWATASETDNAGFMVSRGFTPVGPWEPIHEGFIMANGSPTQGASYTVVDPFARAMAKPWYLLQDVSFTGEVTAHPPVKLMAFDAQLETLLWLLAGAR